MSINSKVFLDSVLVLNKSLNLCPRTLDTEKVRVLRETFDNLSSIGLLRSEEEITLETLAPRISLIEDSTEMRVAQAKVFGAVGHFFEEESASKRKKDPLSRELLANACVLDLILPEYGCLKGKEKFLSSLKSLTQEGMQEDAVFEVLEEIVRIPEGDRESICMAVELILQGDLNEYGLKSILRALVQIPAAERESVCLAMNHITKEGVNEDGVEDLLLTLNEIDRSEREAVTTLAGPFIAKGMDGYRVSSMLKNIVEIPEGERPSVFSALESVIKKTGNKSTIEDLLSALIKIKDPGREEIVNLVESLIKVGMGGYDVSLILEYINKTPKERREEITIAVSAAANDLSNNLMVSLLNFVITSQPKDPKSFCLSLVHIAKINPSRREVKVVLEQINLIDPEQRLSICAAAGNLVETLKVDQLGLVFKKLAQIPGEKRGDFCRAVSCFINEDMNGLVLDGIIRAMGEIPQEEWAAVCSMVHNITKDMDRSSIPPLLCEIAKIPVATRDSIYFVALPFFSLLNKSSKKPILHCIEILRSITSIRAEDLDEISSLAIPIVKDGEGVLLFSVPHLLSFLQKINQENKGRIFSCLKKIESCGNKPIARSLRVVVLESKNSKEYNDALVSLASQKTRSGRGAEKLTAHKILPSIVPAKWIAEIRKVRILTQEEIESVRVLESFLSDKKEELKGNSYHLMQPYMLTVLTLDDVPELIPSRKLQLLSGVCRAADPVKGLGLIRFLCARKELEALNRIPLENTLEELKRAFEESILNDQFVNLADIDNVADKYLSTFENTRVPFAMDSYGASLRTLGDEEVRKSFERLVRSVLNNTFDFERYDVDQSLHLKKIQEYDQQNRSSFLEDWKAFDFIAPVTPISRVSEEEPRFSMEEFFRMKILVDKHGHLQGIGDQLPELSSFLTENESERLEILTGLNSRVKRNEELLGSEITPDQKLDIERVMKIDLLEKLCMELILDPTLSKELQIAKIEAVIPITGNLELVNDLKALSTLLSPRKESLSSETVEICKGWEDLLLAGTEVMGSCQRIDGIPDLNKCLLAYCLDGKNAMIAVKDSKGKIVARSILRLLWNERESKPALFVDRLYFNREFKGQEKAIQMATKACAKKLGLDLFISDMSVRPDSNVSIQSLGSSCPYEYADASDGVMRNGQFTIRSARKVNLN